MPQGWSPGLQQYMDSLKDADKWGGKPYSSRYIGSLVGDFHRTLLYGGIYGCAPVFVCSETPLPMPLGLDRRCMMSG